MVVFFYYRDDSLPFAQFDYEALCKRLIASAEKFGYEVLHMTLDGGPDLGCRRVVVDGDPEKILLTRMKAYKSAPVGSWLVDCDCVINQPLPKIEGADLCLTWRPGFRQCYNAGVIHFATDAGREMFKSAVDAYAGEDSPWGLDQEILLNAFGPRPVGGHELDGGVLGVLPCEKFNYSPDSDNEDLSGKFIVHYKGLRKAMGTQDGA